MAYPDSGPSSSYSDPIYDRIDTFAQALRRRWWIYALVLVAIIVAAQAMRVRVANRPEEAAATAFNAAMSANKPEDHLAKLRALADDATASPYYRSRALIELTQDQLSKDAGADGKTSADKAVKLAEESKDIELQHAARLSRAAAEFQLGELDAAAADYGKVETAGARYAAQQLTATLGSAATLAKQGKRDEAIAKLEPLLSRNDEGAKPLLDLARVRYWQLKREQAEPAAPAPAPAPQAPTAAQPAAEPAAPAVQGPPAPAAAQPAPAPAAPAAK